MLSITTFRSISIDAVCSILTFLSSNYAAFLYIYTDQKEKIVANFLSALRCCPSTKYLVAKVPDPELGGEIELFFLKVRGVQLDGKRDILALALMAFSV